MAINKISLRKLLRLIQASSKKRRTLLRANILSDLKKEAGSGDSGGDFYVPFWAAAKAHVKGHSNLTVEVPKLIAANPRRLTLYSLMHRRFLEWWTEKRAWRNEPFTIFNENLKGSIFYSSLGLQIKIDNILAGMIADSEYRLVYPYFAHDTPLSLEGARLAIFVLSEAMSSYPIDSFRVLDVVRGVSFSINDCPLKGTEIEELTMHYNALKAERADLLKEYA